jgi:hypothetical protein
MKTIEQKSAIILIKSLKKETNKLWKNNNSESPRFKYLSKLIRELEEEFKVYSNAEFIKKNNI